jgi:hypothetical protein
MGARRIEVTIVGDLVDRAADRTGHDALLFPDGAALNGDEIGKRAADRRSASGIALIQEGKRIFRQRTIMENVMLGTFNRRVARRERRQLCEPAPAPIFT